MSSRVARLPRDACSHTRSVPCLLLHAPCSNHGLVTPLCSLRSPAPCARLLSLVRKFEPLLWAGGERRLYHRRTQGGACAERASIAFHRLLSPSTTSSHLPPPHLTSHSRTFHSLTFHSRASHSLAFSRLSRCCAKRASRARSPSNLKILPSRRIATIQWPSASASSR